MLTLIYQKSFTKDLARIEKRGKDLQKLSDIVSQLIAQKNLPLKNRNHKLKGNLQDCWECHIEPDWLLIYQKTSEEIVLVGTGSHADLF
ncbi:MAG: type II toxin-antitoxin system YafQ family toxin [Candidatus Babeliales bacterium]